MPKRTDNTLKLYIFDTNPTNSTWTDHSTPNINAADIPFLRGLHVVFTGQRTRDPYPWNIDGIGCSFVGTNLYGVMVVVGTPTFGSTSGLTVKLGIIDD